MHATKAYLYISIVHLYENSYHLISNVLFSQRFTHLVFLLFNKIDIIKPEPIFNQYKECVTHIAQIQPNKYKVARLFLYEFHT